MHVNSNLFLKITQDEEEEEVAPNRQGMRANITNRGGWQIEAKPGKMHYLKKATITLLGLFDLNKCRAIARSLEKIRVPFGRSSV